MCQDHQENIRHFAVRVKGQAGLCNFPIECHGCQAQVSYAEEEIKDQLYTGLADPDIQKEVLAQRDQYATVEALVQGVYVSAKSAMSAKCQLFLSLSAKSAKCQRNKSRVS